LLRPARRSAAKIDSIIYNILTYLYIYIFIYLFLYIIYIYLVIYIFIYLFIYILYIYIYMSIFTRPKTRIRDNSKYCSSPGRNYVLISYQEFIRRECRVERQQELKPSNQSDDPFGRVARRCQVPPVASKLRAIVWIQFRRHSVSRYFRPQESKRPYGQLILPLAFVHLFHLLPPPHPPPPRQKNCRIGVTQIMLGSISIVLGPQMA
jgi:Ca2+/Na+ antiporter